MRMFTTSPRSLFVSCQMRHPQPIGSNMDTVLVRSWCLRFPWYLAAKTALRSGPYPTCSTVRRRYIRSDRARRQYRRPCIWSPRGTEPEHLGIRGPIRHPVDGSPYRQASYRIPMSGSADRLSSSYELPTQGLISTRFAFQEHPQLMLSKQVEVVIYLYLINQLDYTSNYNQPLISGN